MSNWETHEFTEAQQQALDKVEEILKEHFTAAVVAVMAEKDEDDDNQFTTGLWHGGHATCIGLLNKALHRMLNDTEDEA